jgi:hypothetical protein
VREGSVLAGLERDQIELKVHGLQTEEHGRVPARLFANKLKQLVAALEAADQYANGRVIHDYVLSAMHMSEPTAILREVPRDDQLSSASAIPVFDDAVDSIKTQDNRVIALAGVVKRVGLLTSGVSKTFGFAEVRTSDDNVVRIDDFLRSRAQTAQKLSSAGEWFSGAADGSFDGLLNYVDVRGLLPQIKLTLSSGGQELDCICRREDIDMLGDALHKRVRVSGRAIYSESSPLPLRVEVRTIESVGEPGDFTRWRGAFHPFERDGWPHDA